MNLKNRRTRLSNQLSTFLVFTFFGGELVNGMLSYCCCWIFIPASTLKGIHLQLFVGKLVYTQTCILLPTHVCLYLYITCKHKLIQWKSINSNILSIPNWFQHQFQTSRAEKEALVLTYKEESSGIRIQCHRAAGTAVTWCTSTAESIQKQPIQ